MINFLAIHHGGVLFTHHVLFRYGFDQRTKCEVAARELWCGLFCLYFVFAEYWQVQVKRVAGVRKFALMLRMPQFNTTQNWVHHILFYASWSFTALSTRIITNITLSTSVVERNVHRVPFGGRYLSHGCRRSKSGVSCPVPCFIYNIACVLVVIRYWSRHHHTYVTTTHTLHVPHTES